MISNQTKLRVGMNTRLTLILEKRGNVFSVPYDAVKTGKNNESVIFVILHEGKNKWIVKQVPVTTGMESDFSVEISNDDLQAGMKVINDVSLMKDGMQVALRQGLTE